MVGAVDLVTGKAKVEYYLDLSLVLPSEKDAAVTKTPSKKQQAAMDSNSNPEDYLHPNNSKHLFVPCSVVKKDLSEINNNGYPNACLVKTSQDGTLYKIKDLSKLIPISITDKRGVSDVLTLSDVSEASLLHTLRVRYARDDIYTFTGPILLSINPYKPMDSYYSEEQMYKYYTQLRQTTTKTARPTPTKANNGNHKTPVSTANTNEPHLFQVADRAYTALMDHYPYLATLDHEDETIMDLHNQQLFDQSILISGESGAGKTEATKFIMQYLARVATAASPSDHLSFTSPSKGFRYSTKLEELVLSVNPLLESFGNAITLRNDNSSRFGKFIQISFSKEGSIAGAYLSNYLLEKTRITEQSEGERNYHIFYQIFAGLTEEEHPQLFNLISSPETFRYISHKPKHRSKHDAATFLETCHCLSNIGLDKEAQLVIFSIVIAILHIGNIEFVDASEEEGGDGSNNEPISKIASADGSLGIACRLLGLDSQEVANAILSKQIIVGGKVITKPQSVAQARDKRDAFAKLCYASLFQWLVDRINDTISLETSSSSVRDANIRGFIGVLDIYGFENFEFNGFEQLLINYANESMQRHFNKHLFEVEQEIYANEGVDWAYIQFNDNRPCLELLEGGGAMVGILSTLDDAWGGSLGSPSEKDVKFVGQLHQAFGGTPKPKHPYFITPKFGSDKQFGIVHYAGEVRYTANGFVEKNVESLSNELKDLGGKSTIAIVRELFVPASSTSLEAAGRRIRSAIRGVSVASQFRSSLQLLVSDLEKTSPHFIRCIKPNSKKKANSIDSGDVLRQLRYAGMMETIRIRRQGYSVREEHEVFYNRFSVILNSKDRQKGIEFLVQDLSLRLGVSNADWQIGHTKIFLRKELADKLASLSMLRVKSASRVLHKFGRMVARNRGARMIIAWFRYRMHIIEKKRRADAATLIAAVFRVIGPKRKLKLAVQSSIMLQSLARIVPAKEYLSKLRDPYGELSFSDLQRLLESMQAAVDDAISSKAFKKAAELEEEVARVKEVLEAKRPLTRAIIERTISETQREIDEALGRKDFNACAALHEKMEKHILMRSEYPTLQELEVSVSRAEEELKDAVARRDFAGAASCQVAVDEARRRLVEAQQVHDADAIQSGDLVPISAVITQPFSSRIELEAKILSVMNEMETAVSNKQFSKANELHVKVIELEALRPQYPSIEDLQEEIAGLQKEMKKAISKKAFQTAGELQEKIEKLSIAMGDLLAKAQPLETGNQNSKDEEFGFSTRIEIDLEIGRLSSILDDAVASKKFDEATSIQSRIKEIETLVCNFPSLEELDSQLAEKQKLLENAVKTKKIVAAKELNEEVEELSNRYRREKNKYDELKPLKDLSKSTEKEEDSKLKKDENFPKLSKETVSSKNKKIPNLVKPLSAVSSGVARGHNDGKQNHCPVSKLRPKKPYISSSDSTILSVTQMLAAKRGDAVLIAGSDGSLTGIITDTDITRRLVSRHLDASETVASSIMTPSPKCVSLSDSAMDALTLMVENHFRHLPVLDDDGSIVGLLDIAKCLNDAISKLERANEKGKEAAQDAVKQLAGLQGAGTAQAAALQLLLGPLMSQAFGGKTSPTLRSLLAGKPKSIVSPSSSIRDAGMLMSESRKASLVVERGELVGIFGFKDMMTRAVAKELPLDSTPVSKVMTPNPEFVSPDLTVVEALQVMHDNKFLTLPVCESDGTVVGLVDVMDLIYGCGGTDGWRSIFDAAMDCVDDQSEINSVRSGPSIAPSTKTNHTSKSIKGTSVGRKHNDCPVSKLRPKKPYISSLDSTILSVTQMLAAKRGDAVLIAGSNGGLTGIITDTDITRRLVSRHLDASETVASSIMTPSPKCVSLSDSAMDALTLMVENHFRHLPVLDDDGSIVGLLDIAKCLNDAISKLERANEKGKEAAQDAVKQLAGLQGAGTAQAAALQLLLGPLMSQAFGGKTSPTLRSLLAGKPKSIVSPSSSIRDAGMLMSESRKASLVVERGELVGIFGFKDMMTRAVAKELPLDSTPVSKVMTPNPEFVSPDLTVVEALQVMHDNKFLTLPVCESDGTVVGLVDVMDLIYGCGGTDGWRSIFDAAMDCVDDQSEINSVRSGPSIVPSTKTNHTSKSKKGTSVSRKHNDCPVSKLRPKKPYISSSDSTILSVTQMLAAKRGDAVLIAGSNGGLTGIITDTDITRRLVSRHLDASETVASSIMTPSPKCVSLSDSAMDALTLMVENHFRHLPVLDDDGSIVGLLDIAKCLNDAISKLERANEKGKEAAQDAVKQLAGLQGAGTAQAAALQLLLGPLMSQAFGGKTSPTLRSLLAGKPKSIVSPSSSIRDAGMLMSESRKASLVVERGELVGIFGFKDMMTRAVAKELPLDSTPVSKVMTPNPEFVSPDLTVVEALQVMHDNKFLTLPVCESDGTVVGLVDVMDLIYGCGGTDGWRSIFDAAMDCVDDQSEINSVRSGPSIAPSTKTNHTSKSIKGTSVGRKHNDCPVSKLRPKKPYISSSDSTILSVTQMLAAKRGDAVLIAGSNGGLTGIITDTDITRRLVSRHLDASETVASSIMTPSPKCVSLSDSAMDALTLMVENHFRHLPVLDDDGSIVGLLDIAKCLNDAISKLERANEKGKEAAQDAVKQLAGLQGAGTAQAAALQLLLGPLMSQAFGGKTSPTLRSLLAGKPKSIVSPSSSIRDAGMLMSESRKASLVVERGELVGIFGFKDMMTRAVAKELPLDSTPVSEVMTPNPEFVSPDLTVVEALQVMHDNKFLTLPVCESDGTVVGLVDVMDLIYGCGGTDGWRSIFDAAMDCVDDQSEINSVRSGPSIAPSTKTNHTSKSKKGTSVGRKHNDCPVSKLRPKKPYISSSDSTILSVTQMLAAKRGDAVLIAGSDGGLTGIITDTDITRRLVSRHLDASETVASSIMTPSPKCVSLSDSAMDALIIMVENHFRHLPVLDDDGSISGLLDIAKCLNDAISKLERANEKGKEAAQDAVKQLAGLQGAGTAQAAALQLLLGPLMSQAFGGKTSPTLRSLLAGKPKSIVSPSSSIRDAGMLMSESRKASLVVERGELVGIFGFKDMMTRAVAKELPLDSTPVSKVMTPNPEYVSPDLTVVEALQVMHDNKFLTLPVCESDGTVVGLVDVMDLIYGCGGTDGWRSIFDAAMECDDEESSTRDGSVSDFFPSPSLLGPERILHVKEPTPIESIEFVAGCASDDRSFHGSVISDMRSKQPVLALPDDRGSEASSLIQNVVFKIADSSGNIHRVNCEPNFEKLLSAVASKLGENVIPSQLQIKFVDDEGDDVVISSSECLVDAVDVSRSRGGAALKLSVAILTPGKKVTTQSEGNLGLLLGIGGAVAIVALGIVIAMRPRK